MKRQSSTRFFYGTTTLGEKGQVVIPAEARKDMSIKKGEKLLVFAKDKDVLVFCKLADLAKITSKISAKLRSIQGLINVNQK